MRAYVSKCQIKFYFMLNPLLPILSSLSPLTAITLGSYVSSAFPKIPAIANRFFTAIDLESQIANPNYGSAVVREGISQIVGHGLIIVKPSLANSKFTKLIDVAASGFRAFHQWNCVKQSSGRLVAVLRGEPPSENLRRAALQRGVIVNKTSSINLIIPAINRIAIDVLKFIYYCGDVKRSIEESPSDSAPFAFSNLSSTLRLIQTQPQYLDWVVSKAGIDIGRSYLNLIGLIPNMIAGLTSESPKTARLQEV